jgi:hypothetical protein
VLYQKKKHAVSSDQKAKVQFEKEHTVLQWNQKEETNFEISTKFILEKYKYCGFHYFFLPLLNAKKIQKIFAQFAKSI